MTQPSGMKTKRPGRPKTTGSGMQISPRWNQAELEGIDDWILSNGNPTRVEAIRRMVNQCIGNALRVVAANPCAQAVPALRPEVVLLESLVNPEACGAETRIVTKEEPGTLPPTEPVVSSDGIRRSANFSASLEELGRRAREIIDRSSVQPQ